MQALRPAGDEENRRGGVYDADPGLQTNPERDSCRLRMRGREDNEMKTPKHSLRKIVTFLNNPDEDGGFWLPNIQRPFVWSEEQMCRLFDSILRQYPISTLLVWKTKSELRRRKFIDNFHEDHRHRLSDFYVPVDDKKKCLVLDGQLRQKGIVPRHPQW